MKSHRGRALLLLLLGVTAPRRRFRRRRTRAPSSSRAASAKIGIAKLAGVYRQFLIDVEPIMQPSEIDTFLILESDAQRDLYIADFWRRHDLTEGMPSRRVQKDLLRAHRRRPRSDIDRWRPIAAASTSIHGAPAEITHTRRLPVLSADGALDVPQSEGLRQRCPLPLLPAARERRLRLVAAVQLPELTRYMTSFPDEIIATSTNRKRQAFDRVFGLVPHTDAHAFSVRMHRHADEMPRGRLNPRTSEALDNAKIFQPPAVDPEQVRKIFHSVVMQHRGRESAAGPALRLVSGADKATAQPPR